MNATNELVTVLVDEVDDHLDGRSSSAAKKAEARFNRSLARRNSRFSCSNCLIPGGLDRGDAGLHAVIDVGLLDPLPQRLDPAAELLRDLFDLFMRGPELLAQLPHEPDRTILLRIGAPKLAYKVRRLQRTQGGSVRYASTTEQDRTEAGTSGE